LRFEDGVENSKSLDTDIQQMQLSEIRKHLISTGMAWKSEKFRSDEFRTKLQGAMIQLQNRDKTESEHRRVSDNHS
jgi:hypothetical protein